MVKEIEKRVRVDEKKFQLLVQKLSTATQLIPQRRCFVHYKNRDTSEKLDVRIRITNGKPEIVVKGGLMTQVVREEALLPFLEPDIDRALSVMALLGYREGVAGGRRIYRGRLGDVELALQEVLSFSEPSVVGERFLEVEYTGPSATDEIAVAALDRFLSDNQLRAFSTSEWDSYIVMLNGTLNGTYIHGVTPVSVVRELGA